MERRNSTIYIISWNGIDQGGGVERVVGLIKGILEKKYRVVIIDQKKVETFPVASWFCRMANPVIAMVLASLCAAILRKKNDIVIGNGFNAPFIKKDICIAHGCMYTYKMATGKPAWSGSTFFEMLAMRNSRKILPVSREAQKALIQYYGVKEKNTKVVNNGVNTDVFFPIDNRKEDERITILFCGRLEKAKGLELLKKLALQIEQMSNMRIVIATPAYGNENFFTSMRTVEVRVRLRLCEMNQFYNEGQVLFMPSWFEGFEMVTLEALSAGIPVVGNRVGAVAELLEMKFEAVEELHKESTIEEIVMQLQRAAQKYCADYHKREQLHEKIKEVFGLERYGERIFAEVEESIRNKKR